mmetsp:Transcript_14474/g.31774  ORF Transcript_14474/g.31774 Transcript_14474/m.31774 type:complete len:106 (-) Transcript_14474:10-327(-)
MLVVDRCQGQIKDIVQAQSQGLRLIVQSPPANDVIVSAAAVRILDDGNSHVRDGDVQQQTHSEDSGLCNVPAGRARDDLPQLGDDRTLPYQDRYTLHRQHSIDPH